MTGPATWPAKALPPDTPAKAQSQATDRLGVPDAPKTIFPGAPGLEAGAPPTRAEAAPPPGAPEGPAPAQRQIAQALSAQGPLPAGTSGRIDVVLSPAELGRVEITFTPKDATTVITFTAERPETAELLRRNIDLLLEDLRKLGFGEAQLGFGENRGQNAPRAPSFHAGSEPVSSTIPAFPTAPRKGRLDLRM